MKCLSTEINNQKDDADLVSQEKEREITKVAYLLSMHATYDFVFALRQQIENRHKQAIQQQSIESKTPNIRLVACGTVEHSPLKGA